MEERSSSPGLDVERIVHHLQRPGFGISELQIVPAQQVPWHSHTSIGDTFYVLAGRIRVSLRGPEERIELGRGAGFGPGPAGPAAPGDERRHGLGDLLVVHGIGDDDFLPAG